MAVTDAELRARMVSEQLERRGIRDERVLEAMRVVPRHRFVPSDRLRDAYADHPLPIGRGQTISQPYMVARMTELVRPQQTHRILEVGAGSGYQTAILARLCRHVYAVERIEELTDRARRLLADLEIENVTLITGDGTLGWPEEGLFDGVLVAAGAPDVPAPYVRQLAGGGRLVIPVGKRHFQELQVISREEGRLKVERDVACRFVNLIGRHGWKEAD
ncbi:MAG: protein-L-isoaspartate(D-aspartate) O-methyltransferase [bacterium]